MITIIQSTPIFAPGSVTPSCHAATLVECGDRSVLAAWFGGEKEGAPDVAIYMARWDGQGWSQPWQMAAEPGVPLWNPVLHRAGDGAIWLFYKAGPTIPAWTGCYRISRDDGRSWSAPAALPAGLLGPSKNKPLLLSNGDVLSGTSAETWRSWTAWAELSQDEGASWTRHGPICAPPAGEPLAQGPLPAAVRGVIQPAVWVSAPGQVRMLLRATQAVGWICLCESQDGGRTWGPTRTTTVPNPNSGIDAVRLQTGRVALACNPVHSGRSPLSLLVSDDDGETWPERLNLERDPGEYSYPAIIQSADGQIHLAYTWRRETIQHVVLEDRPA